jgi:MotA/TolQ/ExbB proton channel family
LSGPRRLVRCFRRRLEAFEPGEDLGSDIGVRKLGQNPGRLAFLHHGQDLDRRVEVARVGHLLQDACGTGRGHRIINSCHLLDPILLHPLILDNRTVQRVLLLGQVLSLPRHLPGPLLEDPSKIGAGMAIAMITTLYGSLGANLIALPLAGKLEARSKEETLLRELMIQGLVAMVDGETPRAIETKLKAFLAPKARQLESA